MKRDFYENLLNWKNEDILTPLLVIGARQVGKTYIIDKFCKEQFEDYIYISLFDNPEIIKIFAQEINTEEKVKQFMLYLHRDINENTVIFIDEAQKSKELLSAMKWFCENEFPYKIILAGSLLGVTLMRLRKVFPVGKVHLEYMYPLSFKEFLVATENEEYIKLIEKSFNNNEPMNDVLHNDLLKIYRNFLYTGGMPRMVQQYINKNKDLSLCGQFILSDINAGYISDMHDNAENVNEAIKIEKIYRNIPSQLAKENKKYQISKIAPNARNRDYRDSMNWLLASKLIVPAYFVNYFETPLKSYMDEDSFKMYLSDTGLLVNLAGLSYEPIIANASFMFIGALTENYVANELQKNRLNLYYYQKDQQLEIDFLIDVKDGIIPIEVKASDEVRSTSLNKYIIKNNPKYAIRISSKNFGFENNIKSVPLYAVFCIKDN